MKGKLYVVGTPIGNLGDFSSRAIETLENCDFIAVEDTRVTLKLLNHFIYRLVIPSDGNSAFPHTSGKVKDSESADKYNSCSKQISISSIRAMKTSLYLL